MAITRHTVGGRDSIAETRQDGMETGAVLTPRLKLWNFNVLLNFILVCAGIQTAQTGLEIQKGERFESSWPGP